MDLMVKKYFKDSESSSKFQFYQAHRGTEEQELSEISTSIDIDSQLQPDNEEPTNHDEKEPDQKLDSSEIHNLNLD